MAQPMISSLPHYAEPALTLPPMASWPASHHQFDATQIKALQAAEAAGRPLLVLGDPGTGKSQLAHAAAFAAKRRFLPFVVDGRTEAADLMWRYDAVARLADAHLAALPGHEKTMADLDAAHYVQPGPLWWAFDPESVQKRHAQARCKGPVPSDTPFPWVSTQGTVVLVDEIDKAEPDVPNGLLEALGNGRFAVPLTGEVVQRPASVPQPLVIFTSNNERELPAAFLRRCLVLTLRLPEGGALHSFLVQRGQLHFPELHAAHESLLAQTADMLIQDRAAAQGTGRYQPGLAEYLDLLRALQGLGGDPNQHLDMLREFTFHKQAD